MYTFTRIKAHRKCDITGWYLKISDYDLLLKINGHAARALFLKFGKDPHLFDKNGIPKTTSSLMLDPIALASKWLSSATNGLNNFGVIYVNRNNGIVCGDHLEIIEQFVGDKIEFPACEKDDVRIVISKWGGCKHFYLSSDKISIFSGEKYNTFDDVMTEALKYAHPFNITQNKDFKYSTDGD